MNTKVLIYSGVGVAGAAVGFGAGYVVSKKRHEAIADAEIESVKETYAAAKAAVVEKPELIEVVGGAKVVSVSVDNDGLGSIEVVGEKIEELGTEDAPTSDLDPEAEKLRADFEASRGEGSNVFTKYGAAFGDVHKDTTAINEPVETAVDVAEELTELTTPSDTHPYLISIDDFHDGTWDKHAKLDVTYFVEDNILIDERETIIPNINETIGTWALDNFGNLSLDPEVVYVRNVKLGADFEVTRDKTSYQEQILGLKS